MSILSIIILIVVVGVVLWMINSYIPMDSKVKAILNIVVVIILIVFLLKVFGVWQSLGSVKV